MKKIITLIGVGMFATTFAQDMPEKKTSAGIVFGAGMNFQKMGTKMLESAGPGGIFTVGANANIRLSGNVALCTGLEFDFSSWKYDAVDKNVYYRFDDTEILQYDDSKNAAVYNTDEDLTDVAGYDALILGGGADTTEDVFNLTQRKHKLIYATVPLMFTFRTNYFGNFRYFGKFGLRTGFALSSKINDQGGVVTNDNQGTLSTKSGENENMKAKNEVFFIKSAIGIAGGAEWKFTSSTSLLLELGFYYGITPLHVTRQSEKPDNNHLYSNVDNSSPQKDGVNETNSYFASKATQTQLMLKVGILF